MPRGIPHPPELKAAAVAALVAGEKPADVARRFGVSQGRLTEWRDQAAPSGTANARTREELAALVYDTVVETLNALRVRARVTGREDWITQQSAADLAALDTAQWDRIIRVLAGFRPADQALPPGEGD